MTAGSSVVEPARPFDVCDNGLQGRLGGGCSLNRDIPAIINAGRLTIEQLDTYYAKGDPKTHGWTFEGTATTPTPAPS